MRDEATEIRWHGRGGQGAKTAAQLVAQAALEEGKCSQGFPEYGPERMGAPIRGFTRVSDAPIRLHCPIEQPDVVVVLDDTLLACRRSPRGPTKRRSSWSTPRSVPARHGTSWVCRAARFSVSMPPRSRSKNWGGPCPTCRWSGPSIKATGCISLPGLKKNVEKKFRANLASELPRATSRDSSGPSRRCGRHEQALELEGDAHRRNDLAIGQQPRIRNGRLADLQTRPRPGEVQRLPPLLDPLSRVGGGGRGRKNCGIRLHPLQRLRHLCSGVPAEVSRGRNGTRSVK